ncbi:Uncharacterised protein [Halioglobus japonicus]|nr:Uncharacterised protein [Halioglobus japonicus]
MVTKDTLDQLRAERSQKRAHPALTPNGPVRTQVNAQVDRERERQIKLHELAFKDAQQHMRTEHALSRHKGQAKAIFNNTKPEMNP